MSNIHKFVIHKHLTFPYGFFKALILLGIGINCIYSCDKKSRPEDVVLSSPTLVHRDERVDNFLDLQNLLVTLHPRVTSLAEVLQVDPIARKQMVGLYETLFTLFGTLVRDYPTFKDTPFSNMKTVDPNLGAECLHLINEIKVLHGNFRNIVCILEKQYQVEASTPATLNAEQVATSMKMREEQRSKHIEELQKKFEEFGSRLPSSKASARSTAALAVAWANSDVGSPRTQRAQSSSAGSPPEIPRMLEVTSPRSGDSGQLLASLAKEAIEKSLQKRASQTASETSPVTKNSSTIASVRSSSGAASIPAAEAREPSAPRKSSAPPVPSRLLKSPVKLAAVSDEMSGKGAPGTSHHQDTNS